MNLRERLEKNAVTKDIFPDLSTSQKEADRLLVEIANEIYSRRKELNKTQQELAISMDVKQPLVCQWESGDYNFTIETLTAVLDKLGVRLELNFSTIDPSLNKQKFSQNSDTDTEHDGKYLDFLKEAA